MADKTSIVITVPTDVPGEQAYFTIEFLKANWERVQEFIGLLVKPSDVQLAADMGEWEII